MYNCQFSTGKCRVFVLYNVDYLHAFTILSCIGLGNCKYRQVINSWAYLEIKRYTVPGRIALCSVAYNPSSYASLDIRTLLLCE